MAHYVNMGKLDELGDEILTLAEQNIRGKIDQIINLKDKYEWIGKGSDAYFTKYKEIMTTLYDYSDMVEIFGYFLKYVSEDYSNARSEASGMLKEYIDEQTAGKKSYLWRRG